MLVQDPASESYAFRHELLREALYDELLPRERVALHAALARALEGDPRLAVGAHGAAAQRALHWSAAHELDHALTASVEAGFEAERVWSFAEANAHFEHASELWDHVESEQRPDGISLVGLLGRAAEAAYLSGQSQRAVTLRRQRTRADRHSSASRRRRGWRTSGWAGICWPTAPARGAARVPARRRRSCPRGQRLPERASSPARRTS